MKLVFCIAGTINGGGMERVLSQRVNYFIEKFDYDITIITTENNSNFYKNKSQFFYFNPKVKIIDLRIKYLDFLKKRTNFIKRQIGLKKLKKRHLELLNEVITEIKPDILISLGDVDRDISYKILFPCKKIIENHFTKKLFIDKFENKNYFNKLIYIYKVYKEYINIKKYDKFLVLTEEDKKDWNNSKVKVINNPLPFDSKEISTCKNKKIISVGRLDEQKGFDLLIDVWKEVNKKHSNWILEIYGEGRLREKLQNKIDSLDLTDTLILKGNDKNIQLKYLESSIYVLSSRYEGMPMVLLEAMACGLPLVSFDCPCGPKDVIEEGKNGFLCKFGNIGEMAEKINYLIENENRRIEMGKNSKELSYNYSEEKIMNQWKELYKNLIEKV